MYIDLLRNGYRPIPIGPKSKIPQRFNGTGFTGFVGWSQFTATEADAETWSSWPDAGWGLLTKHSPAVDIDVTDADLADEIEALVVKHLGAAPCRVGKAPKRLLVYQTEEPFSKRKLTFSSDGVEHAIEVLGDGQQFVGGGIHPDTNLPYIWSAESPLSTPLSDLPMISATRVDAMLEDIRETLLGRCQVGRPQASAGRQRRKTIGSQLIDAALAAELLSEVPNDFEYLDWIKVSAAYKQAVAGDEDAYPAFETWCMQYEGNTPQIARAKWSSINDSSVGLQYLVELASEICPDRAASFRARFAEIERRGLEKVWDAIKGEPLMDLGTSCTLEEEPYAVGGSEEADEAEVLFPLCPPGLVGQIARYHDATSIRVAPLFGVAAGLSAVSALAGGLYETQMPRSRPTSTALYIMVLGGTGSGKEGVRSVVGEILKLAASEGKSRRVSAASAPALLRYLHSRRDLIWMPDEFGRQLNFAANPSGGHQYQLMSLVMSLYGLFHGSTEAYAYADAKQMIDPVEHPYLNVLATATPASVKDALGTGAIIDGTLNRFIVVMNDDLSPAHRDGECPELDEATRDAVLARSESAQLAALLEGRGGITAITVDDDAAELLLAYRDEVEESRAAAQGGSDRAEPMWSRVYENAVRVAGVVAYGDTDPLAPRMRIQHADWSIQFMRWATQQALKITRGMADSPSEQRGIEILDFVGSVGGWVPRNEITRRFQRMPRREREATLDDLVEGGFLKREKDAQKTMYLIGRR